MISNFQDKKKKRVLFVCFLVVVVVVFHALQINYNEENIVTLVDL